MEKGFNPSQWFVPTKEQLNLAYQNPEVRKHFASITYWSSTEFNATIACRQCFCTGIICNIPKTYTGCVHPFRCVTY